MKTIACIFMMASFCSVHSMAQSQLLVGADILSELTFGAIKIHGSYGFHPHWSAAIEAGIDLNAIPGEINPLDKEHGEGLGYGTEKEEPEFRKDCSTLCIHIDFWPQKTHKGPCISLGGRHRDRTGADFIIGLGYYIPIWRGLGIDIHYQMGMIETYKSNELSLSGIRGGLHYVF